MGTLRAAEFFAGIGLMRRGLEQAGVETVWANDVEAAKRDLYAANFGPGGFVLGDVRDVRGKDLPAVDVATASFPCTDLSLAGARRGLGAGGAPRAQDGGSSMFWEFARVLDELSDRRPPVVLLENVLGFASSHGGRDLTGAVAELNRLGYSCDLMAIDARHFVPQSRPRMFVVGLTDPAPRDVVAGGAGGGGADRTPAPGDRTGGWADRPAWAHALARRMPRARLHARALPPLPDGPTTLDGVVERLAPAAPEWWDADRQARFVASLSPVQSDRLAALVAQNAVGWRTAYRRTRSGVAVWEIRADGIAGCLRTARGGSSRQAIVEAGGGALRVRWMTPREYARLMGAGDFVLPERSSRAVFGFGDAVCVPVVAWLCEHYVVPAARAATVLAAA